MTGPRDDGAEDPAAAAAPGAGGPDGADRAVLAAAALLVALGLLAPLAAAASPTLAASLAFHEGAPEDPWGAPWAFAPGVGDYSPGPDGRDDGGREDDVRVLPAGDRALVWARAARPALFSGGVLLAALWFLGRAYLARLLAPRGDDLAAEVLQACALALPLVGLLVLAGQVAAWTAPAAVDGLLAALRGAHVVTPEVAVLLSLTGLAVAAVLAVRLGRPRGRPGAPSSSGGATTDQVLGREHHGRGDPEAAAARRPASPPDGP